MKLQFSKSVEETTEKMLKNLEENSQLRQLIFMSQSNEGQKLEPLVTATKENYEKEEEYLLDCLLS